jgi:FKBP-type peptidyl-prolyl cis-trans isomerase FkpA
MSPCRNERSERGGKARKNEMRKIIGALLFAAAALSWGCQKEETTAPAEEETTAGGIESVAENEKTIYALGAMLGQRAVQPLHLSEAEVEVLLKGVASTARGGQPDFSLEEYAPKLEALMKERAAAGAAVEKEKSRGFLDEAANEEGAVRTASGLVFRTLEPGDGPSPGATDVVRVHYHGTLTDGTVFDSSRERGEPVVFSLNQMIPCWTEGLQKMKVGETAQLVCPSDIAYGDGGRPGIPGGATLIFEVELLGIQDS